jgi:hypothetical protein
MEKVGLKIVDLIHAITQKDYGVSFKDDFEGMVRIEYTDDTGFYHHEHLGFPGCERIQLEKAIIKSLSNFLNNLIEIENQ